jgi:hypothetical protein
LPKGFGNYFSMLRDAAGYCEIPSDGLESFPFNRPGRLARHVINDAIFALNLVDDAGIPTAISPVALIAPRRARVTRKLDAQVRPGHDAEVIPSS